MDAVLITPEKTWVGSSFKHDRQLFRCRFSPCGWYVVAGGLDGKIHRWELETEAHALFEGHTGWIGGLAFHPDPSAGRLYAVDYSGALFCWPSREPAPRPLWNNPQAHTGWPRAIAVSPDGKWVATAGSDRAVRVWAADTGKLVKELEGHKGDIFSLGFHPQGKGLVSGDLFGVVKHWEVPAWKLVRDLDAGVLHTRGDDFLADVGGVRALAFDPGGLRLACGGLAEAQSNTFCPGTPAVLLLDWLTGETKLRLSIKEKADGFINGLRFLRDGTLAGTGEGQSGAGLSFWRGDQPEPVHSLPGPSAYDLDLHPDGLRLAAPLFDPRGTQGNGRKAKMGEYTPHGSVVRVFNVYPKA